MWNHSSRSTVSAFGSGLSTLIRARPRAVPEARRDDRAAEEEDEREPLHAAALLDQPERADDPEGDHEPARDELDERLPEVRGAPRIGDLGEERVDVLGRVALRDE